MSSHLTPEQRPDKNGKIVTRHVRPQSGTASSRTIPAPVSQVESLISQFEATVPSWSRDEHKIPVLRMIAKDNPDLFADIMRSYLSGGREEQAVWRLVLFQTGVSSDQVSQVHYRRMIELVPLSVAMFPDAPPGYRDSMVCKHASSSETELSIRPGDEKYDLVKARIIIAEAERKSSPGRHDRSEDIAFIARHLEEVAPLTPELVKRGTASAGLIRELLESAAKPLREGAL